MKEILQIRRQKSDVGSPERAKRVVSYAPACVLVFLACAQPVPFEFITYSLKPGRLGQVYADTIRTAGGRGEVSMRIKAGQLPPGIGLRVSDSDGILYGEPTRTGDFAFTVEARDSSLTERPVLVELISHSFALAVDSL